MKKFLLPVLAIFLQSCNGNMMGGFTNSNLSNETQENYEEYSKPTSQLNKTRELLDGASINFPTLTATGYAVVSTQPGQNVEQKRLMAKPNKVAERGQPCRTQLLSQLLSKQQKGLSFS